MTACSLHVGRGFSRANSGAPEGTPCVLVLALAPMERLQPLIGLALIALIAYSLSTNRKAIRLRTILWGFGLQFLFALIVLKTPYGQYAFEVAGEKIRQLLGFAAVGSSF